MKKALPVFVLFAVLILTCSSCDWAKDKTKKAINKTGEIVGKTGSEFGDGVYKGIKKTFDKEVKIAEPLKAKGLELGEVLINSSDSATDNVLTAYMIFNDNFDQEIRIKIFTEDGKEYGRLKVNVKGEKDEAKYVDFIFDKQVNIGAKSNILLE